MADDMTFPTPIFYQTHPSLPGAVHEEGRRSRGILRAATAAPSSCSPGRVPCQSHAGGPGAAALQN